MYIALPFGVRKTDHLQKEIIHVALYHCLGPIISHVEMTSQHGKETDEEAPYSIGYKGGGGEYLGEEHGVVE
jgi:hypothetical protein